MNTYKLDLKAYCQRIRYKGKLDVSLETLEKLHLFQVMNVPFENLDLQMHHYSLDHTAEQSKNSAIQNPSYIIDLTLKNLEEKIVFGRKSECDTDIIAKINENLQDQKKKKRSKTLLNKSVLASKPIDIPSRERAFSLNDSLSSPQSPSLFSSEKQFISKYDIVNTKKPKFNHKHNGRGGYCFENNGLFSAVLSQIGFNVKNLLARVYTPPKIPENCAENHQIILVSNLGENNESYICDVG